METKEINFTMDGGDVYVTAEITLEKLQAILDKIIGFAEKTNQATGEGIVQNDDCNIEASSLLADIWDDIIKPVVRYKD